MVVDMIGMFDCNGQWYTVGMFNGSGQWYNW